MALPKSLAKNMPGPGDAYIASRLIGELFAGYEEEDRITVLDLGPGNAATVNFLSRYRSRIFFADLLDHPHPRNRKPRQHHHQPVAQL